MELTADSSLEKTWAIAEPSSPRRSHRWVWAVLVAAVFTGLAWYFSQVTVIVDGHRRHWLCRGRSVAEVLRQRGIVLGAADFTAPPLSARLSGHSTLRVTRVIERPINVVHWVPPAVHSALDTAANLRPISARRGWATETTDTFLVTFYDGAEARRRQVHERVARQPFYGLTLLDAKGKSAKTYDLTKVKAMKMIATGYYVGDPLVPSDETRLGYKLRRGLVAVDPKIIPLRTRLYIPGYGYAYAADTGGRIKNNRIDLAVKDRHEERRYMHRPMTVYVLDNTAHW